MNNFISCKQPSCLSNARTQISIKSERLAQYGIKVAAEAAGNTLHLPLDIAIIAANR